MGFTVSHILRAPVGKTIVWGSVHPCFFVIAPPAMVGQVPLAVLVYPWTETTFTTFHIPKKNKNKKTNLSSEFFPRATEYVKPNRNGQPVAGITLLTVRTASSVPLVCAGRPTSWGENPFIKKILTKHNWNPSSLKG